MIRSSLSFLRSALLVCAIAGGLIVGMPCLAAAEPLDPLLALPDPGRATLVAEPFDPEAGTRFGPGVRVVPDGVVLAGRFLIEQGPTDGMEVLACLPGGKTHEALIQLEGASGVTINAACIIAFGEHHGIPAEEGRGVPPRGLALRVTAHWKGADGAWRAIDASSLVRDRVSDRPYPPLPWIYTGSRMLKIAEAIDGRMATHDRYMLDVTKSVAVNFNEADALLASVFPGAADDQRFEANSAVVPPTGTQVWLRLQAARPALRLSSDEAGALAGPSGPVADDAALVAVLAQLPAGGLRAVAVATPDAAGEAVVLALHARLLAAAIAAKVWVVPVFVRE